MTALDGVKVIDLGQFYFGPYCSMLLARLGADVIKIESPGGDPYRRLPTAYGDGVSVQFGLLNSGKKMMRLDLKKSEGRDVLLDLVKDADVLVQNLSPGAMERFGLGYEALSRVNPRLVMASGTGYGSSGPYAGEPAMDLTIQARTAVMSTTGFDEGPPTRTGPSVVDFMGGAHLISGVLAALFQRERTGSGQHVEVSLQDALIPSLSSNIAGWVNSEGRLPERTGNRNGGLAVAPYNAYPTTDGWMTILCPTDAHWHRLCELMGDPAAADGRYDSMAARCAEMDAVDELVGGWTKWWAKDELAEMLKGAGIPSAAVVTLTELMSDPHVEARGVLRRMRDARGDWLTYGSPLFLSDSPTVDPSRPGRLGEDTDDILADLGRAADDVTALRAADVI